MPVKDGLFVQIRELLQVQPTEVQRVRGADMAHLPRLANAWLLVLDGIIADYGTMDQLPESTVPIHDCTDRYILPALVDSHTHLVFPGWREEEFVMRLKGLDYEAIAKAGGGILNTANKLAAMDEEMLYEDALARAQVLMNSGTGAIEIKSGYGLSMESELKMLRVIRRLKDNLPIEVRATFLGAHAIPARYQHYPEGYVDEIIGQMLPRVAGEGLADYIDVFCERGYFSPVHMDRILEAGAAYGLKAKVHVNQFSSMGGLEVALKHQALSVDHLEVMATGDLELLAGSNTIPVALPGCSFFLGIPYAPARQMIDMGMPLVLATDYNPGSSPSGNMPFVLSLACIKLKMTPNEAIHAATINAAAALELNDDMGSISRGKKAKLIITKPMPSLEYWMYAFGNGADMVQELVV
ncbi:MAG: imidazolonepropionase [Bacteroidetes bacterium]|jgi:imidazolonepropionase|nr:imidazolonepropionase [Bacteroidota bacterium]